jgi:hypothetical protein
MGRTNGSFHVPPTVRSFISAWPGESSSESRTLENE